MVTQFGRLLLLLKQQYTQSEQRYSKDPKGSLKSKQQYTFNNRNSRTILTIETAVHF